MAGLEPIPSPSLALACDEEKPDVKSWGPRAQPGASENTEQEGEFALAALTSISKSVKDASSSFRKENIFDEVLTRTAYVVVSLGYQRLHSLVLVEMVRNNTRRRSHDRLRHSPYETAPDGRSLRFSWIPLASL